MSDEDLPSVEMDVISHAKESPPADQITFNFYQKHEYSLSELPPLEQLDRCSDETRAFVMEAYSKEQDFRHSMIRQEQQNIFTGDRDKGRANERQQRMGSITGCIIVLAALVWSAVLIMNGYPVVGLVPLVGAIGLMAVSVAWGKKQRPTEKQETDPSDKH
jgi:uncharacterized membrane protein